MHVGIANPRWRGKGSRHSQRMRKPQFCVSGKRPIDPWLDYTHLSVNNTGPIKKVDNSIATEQARHLCQDQYSVKALNPKQNGQHFADGNSKSIFFCWKWLYFNVAKACSWESNWSQASLGSANILVSNRRHVVMRTNDSPVHWRITTRNWAVVFRGLSARLQ